jgi:outer membrane protein
VAGWNLGVLAGPLYAQRRYDGYFYTVAPQYATAERPAYQAPGGYAGSQLLLASASAFPNYWIGAYVRHDWLQGRPSSTVRWCSNAAIGPAEWVSCG